MVNVVLTVGGKSFDIAVVVESILTREKPLTVNVTTVLTDKVRTLGHPHKNADV